MRQTVFVVLLFIIGSCANQKTQNEFWNDGKEVFEVKEIFADERFPNVVTAKDGSIVATWGSKSYQVRRSEDGGKTWSPINTLANPGFQGGGGVTVDENSGDILAFVEEGHPISPFKMYRSKDHGKSWATEETTLMPDKLGNTPWLFRSDHASDFGQTVPLRKIL